jgi:hypothetical protein
MPSNVSDGACEDVADAEAGALDVAIGVDEMPAGCVVAAAAGGCAGGLLVVVVDPDELPAVGNGLGGVTGGVCFDCASGPAVNPQMSATTSVDRVMQKPLAIIGP